MWKQLTQRARKAVFLAQEEAGRLGYNHVGPEHLLLALIREDDCVAAQLLERLGVDLGTLRVEVLGNLSRGDDHLGDDMQLTAEAKQAIDLAFDEAKRTNDDWIGTEHLLVGLAREPQGLASRVLSKLGASPTVIVEQLRGLQAGTLPFDRVEGDGPGSASLSQRSGYGAQPQ